MLGASLAPSLRPDDAKALFAAIDESRAHLRRWVSWVDRHGSVEDTGDDCARCAVEWLLRTEPTLGIVDAVKLR